MCKPTRSPGAKERRVPSVIVYLYRGSHRPPANPSGKRTYGAESFSLKMKKAPASDLMLDERSEQPPKRGMEPGHNLDGLLVRRLARHHSSSRALDFSEFRGDSAG